MEYDPRSKPLRIEPEVPGGADAIPVEPMAKAKSSGKRCVACGMPMGEGSMLCSCGEPVATAAVAIPSEGNVRPCPKCGYDLQGLAGPRCPECGTVVRGPRGRRRVRGIIDHKSAKLQWAAAAGVLGGSLAVCLLITLLGSNGGTDVIPDMLIKLGTQVLLLWVVFFIFAVMWTGADDAWPITLARLAGTAVLAGLVGLLVNFVPVFVFGFATLGFVFVVALCLWNWLDLEPTDAFLIAGVAGIMRVLIFYSLFMK